MEKSPLHRGMWVRCGLAAALLALLASGCGISGGSVPTGRPRPGRVAGVVVRALDPSERLAGALVTVEDAAGGVHRAEADSQGGFAVEAVPAGLALVTAAGPGLPAETVRVPAQVAPEVTVNVLLAVLPGEGATPALPPGGVLPDGTLFVAVGSQQAVASAAGQPVSAPPVPLPSFVVEGGVGYVGPDGVFHALAPGTGTIRAILGGTEEVRAIQVGP